MTVTHEAAMISQSPERRYVSKRITLRPTLPDKKPSVVSLPDSVPGRLENATKVILSHSRQHPKSRGDNGLEVPWLIRYAGGLSDFGDPRQPKSAAQPPHLQPLHVHVVPRHAQQIVLPDLQDPEAERDCH